MANPVLLFRFKLAASQWIVRVSTAGPADSENLPLGAFTGYNSSLTGDNLRSILDGALDSHSVLGNFTVTFSLVTGKFTISNAAVFELDFTHASLGGKGTALRDWLGFTGNKSGASSYTSDNVAQGIIFAGSGRAKDTGSQPEKTGSNAVAEDGSPARVGTQSVRRKRSFQFEYEPPAAVASPLQSGTDDEAGTVVPWTWFDAWEHCSRTGQPLRYYTSSAETIGNFEEEYWWEVGDELGKAPRIPGKTTFWIVPLSLRNWP